MRTATDSELIPQRELEAMVDDVDEVVLIEDLENAEAAADTGSTEGAADCADADDTTGSPAAPRRAILFGLVVVVGLVALVGWLGFRSYQSNQAQVQRSELLQAARQGALNLTTIDWQHAEADVQRIIDGATGEFYDDFTRRAQPFIGVIKKFESTSVGAIAEAGLQTDSGDAAQALVAVTVQTSNAGAAEQVPRSWRLRISVQKVDDQIKVSNVEFVP